MTPRSPWLPWIEIGSAILYEWLILINIILVSQYIKYQNWYVKKKIFDIF